MKRTSLLVALLVVVGMVVVPAAGVVAQETETEEQEDSVTPGERLSGVVGVQGAEIDGEIERNAFTIALERADDNGTKASHIAEKLNQTEARLAELDERKAELQAQRERGEITEGQYRAKTATMATEVNTAEHQLNQSNATAAGLPAETLEENGVNVTAIRTLMDSAHELSGGEVSETSRSIAGDRSGIPDRGANERTGGDRVGDRNASDDRSGDRVTGDEVGTEREDSTDRQHGSDEERTSDDEQTTGTHTDGDADADSRNGADSESSASGSGDAENAGSSGSQ